MAYPDGCSALLGRRIYGSKVLVREGDLAGVSPYMLLAFQVFGLALRGGYSVGLTGRAMLDEASSGTCSTKISGSMALAVALGTDLPFMLSEKQRGCRSRLFGVEGIRD